MWRQLGKESPKLPGETGKPRPPILSPSRSPHLEGALSPRPAEILTRTGVRTPPTSVPKVWRGSSLRPSPGPPPSAPLYVWAGTPLPL